MDAVAYKNGRKNQWRRQAWNAIAKSVANKADAIVLYLPGSTDLDRPEALRRGFKDANLIAIERDRDVAAELRKRGSTVICGDLLTVLRSWPSARPVSVVVADMQCGFDMAIATLAEILARHPAYGNCTVLVNLQRGRDPYFAELASKLSTLEIGESAAQILAEVGFQEMDTRRNMIFLKLMTLFCAGEMAHIMNTALAASNAMTARGLLADAMALLRQVKNISMLSAEMLPSYRSTARSPFFDSVVVNMRMGSNSAQYRAATETSTPDYYLQIQSQVRSRISAALALRTMRLSGVMRGTIGRTRSESKRLTHSKNQTQSRAT